MAALLTITVLTPQDVLDEYGAGARVYISRGITDDVDDATSLSSVLIVAGTTQYEYNDTAGTPGTDRYFIRYGTASPATSDDYSGWTGPLLAGSSGGEVVSLEAFKNWAGIDDTDDDPWLPLAVGACNRAIIGSGGIGVDIGPSPDTTRTYDACAATDSGRQLWIPGGIRAFTTVEVSSDGSTWTAVTSYVRIGPLSHSRPYGEPGAYIEFKPYTSGSVGTFAGYVYVRITGEAFATFGWDAYPDDLIQGGVAAIQRASADRDRQGQYPNETTMRRYLDPALINHYRSLYFAGVR